MREYFKSLRQPKLEFMASFGLEAVSREKAASEEAVMVKKFNTY